MSPTEKAASASLAGPAGNVGKAGAALALLVAAAFFMENLDGTVIVTALP
ncbi:hypothetical protein BH10PSE18_BH10PSE18_44110 [soil metagenome]